jgi:Protein of unknown function DUF262
MPSKKRPSSVYEELEADPFGQDDPSAESEEDLTGIDASSLGSAVVWGTDWTAATIVDQLQRQTITLDPAFQRRDAWTDERKSRFIESLILGLPIPQLVFAESDKKKGKFIVIDGKQRLLSLSKFTGVGLAPDQQPLVLKGLKIRSDLNKSTYDQLKNDAKFEDLVLGFENQAIRSVVIRGWENEQVLYTIFHRLNTGSVPLSPQELRQALHPGPFLTFAAEFSEKSEPLRELLGLSRPDFRMRDVELVVRFYAFQEGLEGYRGNLKKFLDDACDDLNRAWRKREEELRQTAVEFENSVEVAMKIFSRDNVFRKWDGSRFEKRINRAVFDVVAYSFAGLAIRTAALEKKAELVRSFKTLCLEEPFRTAIESTTKSKQAVKNRFAKWYEALRAVTGMNVNVDLPR